MNHTLAHSIRRQLLPALERSQGLLGVYTRGNVAAGKSLIVIPQQPDWEVHDDSGAVIEEWTQVLFVAAIQQWNATGFGLPKQGDRLTVTMADGVERVYAIAPPKGMRPFDLAPGGHHINLRTKWVK